MLSGVMVLPFDGHAIYPIDFFNNNQQSFNPEKAGDGIPGGEVRLGVINFVLKKGNKIIAMISNNIVITNTGDVQIVDRDSRAPLAIGMNMLDYCQAKNIPRNKWLEGVHLRNNIEVASTFLPIKGVVSSGSNFAPLTYTLKWGRGENPIEWTEFASGSNKEGVLGYWDATGKSGTYAVLLTVTTVNGRVKQAKQVFRLGGTIAEDQVTIVSSPYGTTSLAFPAGTIYNGDEIFLKKVGGGSSDIVVYGKYDSSQLPEKQFTGTCFSQADLIGAVSMERIWLGGEGLQNAGQISEDLTSAFQLNTSPSNLAPGVLRQPFATVMGNDLMINAFYFKTDYDQYIEIFNPTAQDIDLNQYILGDGEGEGRFPEGTVIKASNIIVVARNAERYKEFFPGRRVDFEWDPLQYSGNDDLETPNLLAVSTDRPVYNIELNSSATRGVSLIPIIKPEVYQNINSNQMVLGPVFDFKPDGLQFNPEKPPTLTYRGKLADLNGQDPATLGIYYLNDQNKVEFLPSSRITLYDSDGDGTDDSFMITALVEHFSHYVLLAETGTVRIPAFDKMPLVYNRNGIKVTGKAAAGNWVQLSINGKAWSRICIPAAGEFVFEGVLLQEGTNTLSAYAVDEMGRKSLIANVNGVVLDTIPPVLRHVDASKTFFSPNGDFRIDTGSLGFSVSEPGVAVLTIYNTNGLVVYRKQLDGIDVGMTNVISWGGRDSNKVLQKEGIYRYQLDYCDTAGNKAVDTAGAAGVFIVDSTSPSFHNAVVDNPVFSPNGDGVRDRISVTASFYDVYSPLLFLSARVVEKATGRLARILQSSTEVKPGLNAVVWDGYDLFNNRSSDGEYQIQLSLQDVAGNISPLVSYDITIDTVAPNGFKNAGLVRDKLRRDEYLTPRVTITEPLNMIINVLNTDGSIKATIFSNNCAETNFQTVWQNTMLEDGRYSCRFVFSDIGGNSSIVTIPFLKDSIKPSIDLPDRTNEILTGFLEFNGTITDANLDRYVVYIREEGQGTNWKAVYAANHSVFDAAVFTYNSGSLNGLYSFRVDASDTAGNTNSHLISSVSITNNLNQVMQIQATRIVTSSNAVIPYFVFSDISLSTMVIPCADTNPVAMPLANVLMGMGLQLLEWDGKSTSGQLCPEGKYLVSFLACETNSNMIVQTASIPLIIDRTKPIVQLYSPLGQGVYSGSIPIIAAVSDPNLVQYQIQVSRKDVVEWHLLQEGRSSFTSNAITSFTASGLDGEFMLRVTALDQAFNVTETNIFFTVDSKPAYVAIDSPRLLDLEAGEIQVQGSVTGSGLQYYTVILSNSSGYVCVTNTNQVNEGVLATVPSASLQDGLSSIYVCAVKKSGLSFAKEIKILLDNTAPRISLDTNTLSQSQDGIVILSGTATDENFTSYSISYRKLGENDWITLCTSTIAVLNNAVLYRWNTIGIQGVHELRFSAIDKLGNTSQMITKILIKDLLPKAIITTPLAAASIKGSFDITGIASTPFPQERILRITNTRGETVFTTNVTTVDNAGGFVCSVVGTKHLADGQYTIVLTVVDSLGRRESATRAIYIDNAIPRFEDVQPYPEFFNPKYTINNGVTVSFTLTEAVFLTGYVADGGGDIIFSLKKDVYYQKGNHYLVWDGKNSLGEVVNGNDFLVCLSGKDESGNEAKTNVAVRIDSTPPTTGISLSGLSVSKNGKTIYAKNAMLSLNAVDDRSGVGASYIAVNGSGSVRYTAPLSVGNNGTNTFRYYSVDKLGNIEEAKTKTVFVDAASPTISVQFIGQYTNENGQVNITSNTAIQLISTNEDAEGQSGLEKLEYKFVSVNGDPDLVSWLSYSGSIYLVQNGGYRLYTRAVDKVGNSSELKDSSGNTGLSLNGVNTFPVVSQIFVDPDPFCVFTGSTNEQNVHYSLGEPAAVYGAVFDRGTNQYPLYWRVQGHGYKQFYPEQRFSWTCIGKGRRTEYIQKNLMSGSCPIGMIRGEVTIQATIIGGTLTVTLYTNNNICGTTTQSGYFTPYKVSFNQTSQAFVNASITVAKNTGVRALDAWYYGLLPDTFNSGWQTVPRSNNGSSVCFNAVYPFSIRYDRSDMPPAFIQVKTNGSIVLSTNTTTLAWSTFFPNETAVEIVTYNVSSDTSKKGVEYSYTYINTNAFITKEWSGSDNVIVAGETVSLGNVDMSQYYLPAYKLTCSNPDVVLFISNTTLYAKATKVIKQPWSQDLTPQQNIISNTQPGAKKIVSLVDSGVVIPADVVLTNWEFRVLYGNDSYQPLIKITQTNTAYLPVYELDINAINVRTIHNWSNCPSGSNVVSWNGRTVNGDWISPGKYLLAFQTRNAFALPGPLFTKEITIIRDNTPPTVSLLSITPAVFSPNGDATKDSMTMSYLLKDDYAGINYYTIVIREAGGTAVYSNTNWIATETQTNTFVWSGVSNDGIYRIELYAKDAVGNQAPAVVAACSIDLSKPVTTQDSVTNSAWSSSNVTIHLSAADPMVNGVSSGIAGTMIRYENVLYTNVAVFNLQKEGTNILQYWSMDEAGNSETPNTLTVLIDKTPPFISITGFITNGWYNTAVTPLVSISDSYLQQSSILINGSNYISHSSYSTEGKYVLTAFAADLAGNQSSKAAVFYIDKTAPLTVSSLQDGIWSSTNLSLRLTAQDNASGGVSSGVAYVVAIVDGQTYTNRSLIVVTNEGQTTVRFFAVDKAGNKEAEKMITLNIDRLPPAISITGVQEDGWYNRAVMPVVRITDLNLASSKIAVNGISCQPPLVCSNEGRYQLRVQAADKAGNQAEVGMGFALDLTKPLCSTDIPNDAWYNSSKIINFQFSDPQSGGVASGVVARQIIVTGTEDQQITNASAVTLQRDGDYRIQYNCTDKAGNESAIGQLLVHIDTQPPVLVFTGFTNGQLYSANGIVPGVVISERSLKTNYMAISRDGGDFVLLTPGTRVKENGFYRIKAYAADTAGNSSEIASQFQIDAIPPAIPSGLCGLFITNQILLNWNAVEAADLAGYKIFRDGILLTINSITNTFHSLYSNIQGVHSYQVSAVDKVGNESGKSESVAIGDSGYISFVKPAVPEYYRNTIVICNGMLGRNNSQYRLAAAVFADDSMVPTNWQSIREKDRVQGQEIVSTLHAQKMSDGRFLLHAGIRDAAGTPHQATRMVFIDNTPPETSLVINQALITNAVSSTPLCYTNPISVLFRAIDPTNNKSSSGVECTRYMINGRRCNGWKNWNNEPIVFNQDGRYTIRYHSRDRAKTSGNDEVDKNVDLVIDRISPDIQVTGIVEEGIYSKKVCPRITVSDDNLDRNKTIILLDGKPYKEGSAIHEDGAHVLVVTAEDIVGHKSVKSISFTIDTMVPLIVISGVADKGVYTNVITPSVSFSDTTLRSTSLLLNGKTYVSGTCITTDGIYILTAVASDAAGNSTRKDVSFTIDRISPVIKISGVIPGAFYRMSVTPLVSIEEMHIKHSSIRLNGSPFQSGTTITREGTWTLSVDVEDICNRVAATNINFVIDTTPPQIAVSGVADNAFYKEEVMPAVSVRDANLKESSILLNNSTFVPGTVVGQEGNYSLQVVASDLAGNATNRVLNFVIDKTVPRISFYGVMNNAVTNSDIRLSVGIDDPYLQSSTVRLDGDVVSSMSNMLITIEGKHSVTVDATDKAGNLALSTLRFEIDRTAPEITVTGVSNGGVYCKAKPTIVVADGNLDASSVSIRLDGHDFISGTVVTNLGMHSLQVSARDLAGNQSTVQLSFTIRERDVDELLLFYASYDASSDADYAKGKRKNYHDFSTRTRNGYHFHGLNVFPVLGQGALYKAEGNFNPERGTICLWVRNSWASANYYGEDQGRWIVNAYHGDGLHESSRYMSLAVFAGQGTVFTVYTNKQHAVSLAVDKGAEETRWYAGQRWNHIAIAYDMHLGYIATFINGALQDELTVDPWTCKEPNWLYLGSRSVTDLTGSFFGWFDEVRIYGEPLNHNQINQVYTLHSADHNSMD